MSIKAKKIEHVFKFLESMGHYQIANQIRAGHEFYESRIEFDRRLEKMVIENGRLKAELENLQLQIGAMRAERTSRGSIVALVRGN
jgi:hypothetical protein